MSINEKKSRFFGLFNKQESELKSSKIESLFDEELKDVKGGYSRCAGSHNDDYCAQDP